MDIRNGKYMGEDGQMTSDFFAIIDKLEIEMNDAFAHTNLPDNPDMKKINELICFVNEKVIRES